MNRFVDKSKAARLEALEQLVGKDSKLDREEIEKVIGEYLGFGRSVSHRVVWSESGPEHAIIVNIPPQNHVKPMSAEEELATRGSPKKQSLSDLKPETLSLIEKLIEHITSGA